MTQPIYRPKDFNLSGLSGISDQTLEMHFSLYEGYVKNTNLLNEQIMEMIHKGKVSGKDPAYAELTRRLGFEYGGMVLHEYYFENLTPHGKGDPTHELKGAIEQNFGGFEQWRQAFMAVGDMRGVGWVILYKDPVTKHLSNHWVALHHDGVPSGFKPLLVMDVWEHAYLLDYKPSDRDQYIESFFANIDWLVVSRRVSEAAALRPAT